MECKMTANSNLYVTHHTLKTLQPLLFELWLRKEFRVAYMHFQVKFFPEGLRSPTWSAK